MHVALVSMNPKVSLPSAYYPVYISRFLFIVETTRQRLPSQYISLILDSKLYYHYVSSPMLIG